MLFFGSRTLNEGEWQDLLEELHGTDPVILANAAERLDRDATANDLRRLRELLNGDDAFIREAAAWPISRIVGAPACGELLLAYQRADSTKATTTMASRPRSSNSPQQILQAARKPSSPLQKPKSRHSARMRSGCSSSANLAVLSDNSRKTAFSSINGTSVPV
jgi:hypothetical protein